MNHLQEVFDASYRRLVGQLYGVCGDLTEAEDVVSEAFVRAAERPGRFARIDNPEAWLRTVAVNTARSRHRRRRLGESLLRLEPTPTTDPRHPDLSDVRLALVDALQSLPETQRTALALHYLADLPLAEIAETTRVPLGTVKARLSRGRTALAEQLVDLQVDHQEESRA